MAVVSGYPKLIEVELEADAGGQREIVETWLTVTDNAATDNVWTVTTAAGLPIVNSTWSYGNDFDAGVYARNYKTRLVQRTESNTHFHTTITYRTESDTREDQQREDDPVNFTPIISLSGRYFSRLVERERDGAAVTNAAGDPFPDLEMDDFRPQLRIEKNFATVSSAQMVDFANSVNSSPFWGLQPQQWKLGFPRVQELYRGSRRYFNVVFEFEGATSEPFPDWRLRPLEKGHWYFPDPFDQTVKKQCVDSDGRVSGIPMALDASGEQRAFNADPPYLTVDPPVEVYKLRDFGLLGIPTSGW